MQLGLLWYELLVVYVAREIMAVRKKISIQSGAVAIAVCPVISVVVVDVVDVIDVVVEVVVDVVIVYVFVATVSIDVVVVVDVDVIFVVDVVDGIGFEKSFLVQEECVVACGGLK